ncbi:MAG: DNA polymerase I [Verrucomicrobiota bacterium]
MTKRLFLLDGMALAYRAYFALIRNPIFTSKRVNTSAIYGFTNTLLDIIGKHEPTHIAVVFDTSAPTQRHIEYPAYKAQREEMPEDLSKSLPEIRRILEAFHVTILEMDGYEADDIIGTLAQQAESCGFDEIIMVTPDKDFGQLVTEKIKMYRPGRQGSDAEIWGVQEICQKWGIERTDQVIDILGLMGDASDNIPGITGIGEKTAAKLISQFGSVEKLFESTDQLKGKQKEKIEAGRDQGLLSKKLATIITDVPMELDIESLQIQERDEKALKSLFTEFEFNALGKRLFGQEFHAGRGFAHQKSDENKAGDTANTEPMIQAELKNIDSVDHDYKLVQTSDERKALIRILEQTKRFCFDLETSSLDVKNTEIIGLAFSTQSHSGYYVVVKDAAEETGILQEFSSILANEQSEKIGHNLKFDISVLKWKGFAVRGKLLDTMLAHTLLAPEQRHSMDYLSEMHLGYTPVSITTLIGEKGKNQLSMKEVQTERLQDVASYAAEDADVTLQLWNVFEPQLKENAQEKLFYNIESPLIQVLVDMEHTGISIDVLALEEFSGELATKIETLRSDIFKQAGQEFNLNSPKQLGAVLFDDLQLLKKPKKTKTGQYVTNEQVLEFLALQHDIARDILDYRKATKLKSTYVDALPTYVLHQSGRVHTTFQQAVAVTGRMASQDPNLQNIPIRSEEGREIRKAFVADGNDFSLLSVDYSQIELRVMAELSEDSGMREAFEKGQDIHTATAARVYSMMPEMVDDDMRRTAKMVNFGIIYGISAFGLSQRLGIPRTEAARIIEQYFTQYSGVKKYMEKTVAEARENGYVETISGRRRYLPDIKSANANVRQAAERTAINTPIQGTAADMIKLAMVKIEQMLRTGGYKTRMLLQVHDELVFELAEKEKDAVVPQIENCMTTAIPMQVPLVVETGIGQNWLQAH